MRRKSNRSPADHDLRALDRASARGKVKYQDDHSDDQHDVNQATADVEAKPQQPQDQQDHNNCPQHRFNPPSVKPTSRRRLGNDRSLPQKAGKEHPHLKPKLARRDKFIVD
jgi:hypothetical protein